MEEKNPMAMQQDTTSEQTGITSHPTPTQSSPQSPALFPHDTSTHAIVIGAGMAGLLSARVLADFFDHVLIIDRDQLPDGPLPRKGVPQSHQLHNLLVRGWRILQELFPQLTTELPAAGANLIEWPADLRWLGRAGWSPRFSTGLQTYSASRYLIEWKVREQVHKLPNVSFLQNHRVTTLLANAAQTHVTGVQTQPYRSNQSASNTADTDQPADGAKTTRDIFADLVVDASGRMTRTPQWLETLGYPQPPQSTINPYVGYASRYYTLPDGVLPDWKVLLIQSRPPENNRAAAIFIMENNSWVVTLVGVGKDYPPTEEDGFLDFLHSLTTTAAYDFVKAATPISPIYGYRIPQNRYYHYDRLSRWPENFLVLGDAVCSFNPTYGQGMTISSEGALTLQACLQHQVRTRPTGDLSGLGRRFQQQLAQVMIFPWTFTTGEDLRYPTTEGYRPDIQTKLLQWFLDGTLLYAIENRDVYKTVVEVMHMVKPPQALLRPDIALWAASLNIMRHVYS
jgi:2-polyprenyl-6-methoxyphenol hydroxylase-like FAD-dependent oxidoreductase